MPTKRKNKVRLSKKEKVKKEFQVTESSLDFLNDAWNNLPYDVTVEEKIIFIEITERILKAYNKIREVAANEELMKKN